ncbi:MAG: protein involved in polysaccharide export with SLBB domain [Motiliproteus sp.]|jgi:protein involved in polysaccharide export with SLBB domain
MLSLLLLTTPLSLGAEGGVSAYRLGSGDLLSIQVFGEKDLSLEVRLSDAGSFSYPFLGELNVADKSITQLGEMIRSQLAGDYLVNPNVNVSVLEYRDFFINGEVKKPGGYPYQPGLTLQKAVALAGGFTERASLSKVYRVPDGQEQRQPNAVGLSSRVSPGDIITVEESFF